MGILDFFFRRNKKKDKKMDDIEQPDVKETLEEDPYDKKIKSALSLKEIGRDEDAEILLRQIIEEKEEHVRTWFVLAEHFTGLNQKGRAYYCYKKILEYQPTNNKAQQKVEELKTKVWDRADYLWEYNQEKDIN